MKRQGCFGNIERWKDRNFARKFKIRQAKNKSTERQTEVNKGRQMDTKASERQTDKGKMKKQNCFEKIEILNI